MIKIFKDSELIQKYLEFSNFLKDHPLHNNDRMKIPGIYQDESISKLLFLIIAVYVGMRICVNSYVNQL